MKKRQQKISEIFRRLWRHISTRRRGHLFVFFLLMIAASLAEVVSIGAVLPFLGVLIAPEQVFTHPIAQPFISLLNLKSSSDLLAPLVISFGLAVIFAGVLRIALLWMQMRLSYAMGADFGISIYERTLYQPL
jgi:ABC-type bacteriocin/lantibiotic exporter with double-glycine peptidase domain